MSSLRWFTSVMRVNEIQDSRGKVMHSGNNTLELVMLISGLENNCNHSKEKNKKKKRERHGCEQLGENICSVCSDGEIKACKMRECIKKGVENNR